MATEEKKLTPEQEARQRQWDEEFGKRRQPVEPPEKELTPEQAAREAEWDREFGKRRKRDNTGEPQDGAKRLLLAMVLAAIICVCDLCGA